MIRREAAFALAGSIIYAGTQWLIISVLIKSGGAQSGGEYALYMAILGPIVSLANLSLRSTQVVDSTARWTFSEYLSTRVLASALGYTIAVAIAVAVLHSARAVWAFSALALLRLPLEGVSDIAQGHFQRSGRNHVAATAQALKGVVGIAAFYVVVRETASAGLGFASLAIVSASTFALFELQVVRRETAVQLRFGRTNMDLALVALPLGLGMVVKSIQLNLPRYFLEGSAGTVELGIFAAMAYVTVAGGFISSAVGNAMSPILGKLWDSGDHRTFMVYLRRLLIFDLVIGALLVAGSVTVGERVLGMIYNPEVAAHASVLTVLGGVMTVAFADAHLGVALTSMKRNRQVLGISVIGLLIAAPLAAISVRRFGLTGAAIALGICYASTAAMCAAVVLAEMRKMDRPATRS